MSHVILLNGTSSAGKSSILKELNMLCPEYEMYKADAWFPSETTKKAEELGWNPNLGLDPWFYLVDYVNKKTGKPHFSTEVRSYLFKEIWPAYYEMLQRLKLGKNIIVDTVFEYEPEYERFVSFFKDYKVCKVLVYCPLDILLKRVNERNSLGIQEEQRAAFLAFEQFPAMYKLQEYANEELVDVVASSSIKNALDESIQWLIENGMPAIYLSRLEEFKFNFINAFRLDTQVEIKLVARDSYDIVLHSDKASPVMLAQEIVNKCVAK